MLRVIIASLVMLGLIVGLTIVGGLRPLAAASGDDTHPEMCNVVQAVFMAIMRSKELAYPKNIGASSHPMARLEKFTSSYPALMEVGKDEFSDLISQQDKYSSWQFIPVCDWSGNPQAAPDRMRVEFTNPIFSSNSKLAIIQVSFVDAPPSNWGYGIVCAVRRTDTDWAARCAPGWIK